MEKFEVENGVLKSYNGDCKIVIIPDGVTKIDKNVFHEKGIEEVIIPNTVVEIADFAFGKNRLSQVTIPESVRIIGDFAFYENEKIILGKSACYFNLIKNEMKIYIYWLIKTKYFLDYANEEATGTTIKNVSLAAMRNFPIPLPPLAEQERIVNAVETLFTQIDKIAEQIS